MGGIFPQQADGGIPPNSLTPNNPAQAYAPHLIPPPGGNWPQDTAQLFYGNGCNVRVRPHVINSLISEISATTDRAELGYRSTSLDNLETSIRYLIQRGMPRGHLLVKQTPWFFDVTLDPPATRYSDYMTLSLVPLLASGEIQNQGYVRINVNGLGYVPLFRNDGQEVRAGDLRHGKPLVVCCYQGAFYVVGLVQSQVPVVLVGTIWFWIRPDGNDETGDGTENTAAKAFRTINGAWYAVGSRFSASPTSHIGFRLGIPGDYEGGSLGPYGAMISLTGDVNNPTGYRIHALDAGSSTYCLVINGANWCGLNGLTFVMDNPSSRATGNMGTYISGGSEVRLDNVEYRLMANHPGNSTMMVSNGGRSYSENFRLLSESGQSGPNIRFIGNGFTVGTIISLAYGFAAGDMPSAYYSRPIWYFENIHANLGIQMQEMSSWHSATRQFIQTGCTGTRYYVGGTSNATFNGQPPGNIAGSIGSFSTASVVNT